MQFIGRKKEVQRLRALVTGTGPSLTLVAGVPGVGKTAFLRHALADVDAFWFQAVPLPDPDQRLLLAARIRRHLRAQAMTDDEIDALLGLEPDWPALLQSLVRPFFRTLRSTVVVLDGWDRLVEGRRHLSEAFVEFWLTVRRRGGSFHLVLSGVPGAGFAPFLEGEGPLVRWLDEEIRLGPLPFRVVTDYMDGLEDRVERLRTCSVFGGRPDVVRHLDPARPLAENVRRAVLDPDGPLGRWGTDRLERELQSPARYASILRALGADALEWGAMRAKLPDFASSGLMAPYIQRLESLGLVEALRSLDSDPSSRRRRYRVVDPFTAFWFRFVLPNRTELEQGRGDEVWSRWIAPALDAHLAAGFPGLCREWLADHAEERLPAAAGEAGALWGAGYDLDVAGILANRVPVYGIARWSGEPLGEEVLGEIDRQVATTRYGLRGVGRHRLVFCGLPPTQALRRRAERDPDLHVIGVSDLVGRSGSAAGRAS
jgi:uncharacterized protein